MEEILTNQNSVDQSVQANQPEIPISPNNKNNIYKYLFFIAIIVLLGVIVGFYFLLNNKIKQLRNEQTAKATPLVEEILTAPTETETIPTTTKEITPNTSTNSNKSSDLQTYINKDYGFSFKYPSTWVGQPNKTTGGAIQRLFQYDISPDKSFFQNYLGASVNIMLIGYQGSPTDWYKNNIDLGPFTTSSSTGSVYESKNLTINGYQTFYVKQITNSYTDNSYTLSNGKNYIMYVNFRESEKHYSTSGTIDETNDYTQYLSIFNQIINSIQFNL